VSNFLESLFFFVFIERMGDRKTRLQNLLSFYFPKVLSNEIVMYLKFHKEVAIWWFKDGDNGNGELVGTTISGLSHYKLPSFGRESTLYCFHKIPKEDSTHNAVIEHNYNGGKSWIEFPDFTTEEEPLRNKWISCFPVTHCRKWNTKSQTRFLEKLNKRRQI
jgi:hypothetical protein